MKTINVNILSKEDMVATDMAVADMEVNIFFI